MSEFEAANIAFQEATIAYQNASLAIQEAGLAIQQSGLTATYVQAGIAGVVGLIQCALIAWGLKLMRQSARHRDQQHEENMLALKALIERTAPQN